MQALVFDPTLARLVSTRLLGLFTPAAFTGPAAPLRLRRIPDPDLLAPDWVVLRVRLCGLCGSDAKQVFLAGALDNPMTALISFPQVLGHEVVATVERLGPAARGLEVGQRVVLNPWLSCAPRGLDPCAWCRQGELAQCLNFTRGLLAPGIHHGNSRQATGGFAPFVPAHVSQCIPVPDEVEDEAAVLADPFSVSLHAILHQPPRAGEVVLVYGCGTLGLLAIVALRALHPGVRILAVARFEHQGRLAERLGAHHVLRHRPTRRLVETLAGSLGAELQEPWRGLPMLNGGVDLVYDSVGSAETLEVGVRVTRPRGRIVVLGVEPPRRFEWTPLYWKEIAVVGSNAFAVEEWQGRRQHAMQWYFEWVRAGAIDATAVITHRFALRDYRRAFAACFDQGRSGAVKVLFDHAESGEP